MTGFDETVPPDDTDAHEDGATSLDQLDESENELDEQGPEHDSKNPALEDEATPDEA